MTVVAKSRCSLHKEKCGFNKLVLNKILSLVVFGCINLPLTVKYTSEKFLLDKLFSVFKLEKHRRILLCYFKQRVDINEKITDIVSLFLI